MAEVFQTGKPRREGRVDKDADELRGIRVELGVRSEISVPLEVAGERRGVLAAASRAADFFSEGDLRFLTTVSQWVGMVAHRAELSQQATSEAEARTRRAVAEDLVTVLAHDFRNLLTPLRGRLELLGRRLQREGQDRNVDDVRHIVRTVDRLERLVRDLLDTARLEQGLFVLDPRPIDLVDLARLTAAEIEPTPGAVHVEAPMDELVVSADTSRLRQVIENLLSNALKVQPEHQPVRMKLETDDSYAVLKICDRGPGIAPNVLPNLFQRFGAGAGSVGLGLGLYLARGITEAHSGSLQVESQLGKGSCFTMRLPLEQVAALAVEASGSGQRNGHTTTTPASGGGAAR
jgi:two-component system, OmpR family, sensor kinase